MVVIDPDVAFREGFNPRVPTVGAALASLFLHSNLLHLLANMIFLAAVGPLVEKSVGSARFALLYLLGGLAGVGAHWLWSLATGEGTVLIGASAAIAAAVGYCSVRYMRVRVPLAPNLRVNVGFVSLAWLVLQALGTVIRTGDGPGGTAFWAHLAGFVVGLLLAVAYGAHAEEGAQVAHETIRQMSDRGPAAQLAAAESRLATQSNDLRALRAKAEALEAMHEPEQAGSAWLAVLRASPSKDRRIPLEGLVRNRQIGLLAVVERIALADQARHDNPKLAIELLESVLAAADSEPRRPDALLALAEMTDGPRKLQVAKELEDRYPLHPVTDLARAKGLLGGPSS